MGPIYPKAQRNAAVRSKMLQLILVTQICVHIPIIIYIIVHNISYYHSSHGPTACNLYTREEKDWRDLSRIVFEIMHEGDSPSA